MRSHRQPRVGITSTARSTSNTVPMAQKTCQREKKQSQMRMLLSILWNIQKCALQGQLREMPETFQIYTTACKQKSRDVLGICVHVAEAQLWKANVSFLVTLLFNQRQLLTRNRLITFCFLSKMTTTTYVWVLYPPNTATFTAFVFLCKTNLAKPHRVCPMSERSNWYLPSK